MTQKTTLYVHGMHCASCVVLTQDALQEDARVTQAVSTLATHTVDLTGDFGTMTPDNIAAELTPLIAEHGYTLSTHKQKKEVRWSEFTVALPVAFGFAFLFLLLQKLGIVNIVSTGNGDVTYGTAFFIGIIASLSTCMAVVGGLALSLSAMFAKNGASVRPQLLFHAGRIVAFFVLGGVIGAFGSIFTLNSVSMFALSLMIGCIMLILGINLLDIFEVTKKLQPSMPKFVSQTALTVSTLNNTLTPALVGIATFFLPCGFTQSMQITALGAGGFVQGGLLMLSFALGTLPVLALVSFSSLRINNSPKSGIFFKSAGLLVILFALFNIISSCIAIGLLPPLFNL